MNVNCENVRETKITEDDFREDIGKEFDIPFDNIIEETSNNESHEQ